MKISVGVVVEPSLNEFTHYETGTILNEGFLSLIFGREKVLELSILKGPNPLRPRLEVPESPFEAERAIHES